MNDNYWTNTEYKNRSHASILKENAKKVDRMIVDSIGAGQGSATVAESHGCPVEFGPVRPPIYSKDASVPQETARDIGDPAPKLIRNPKHKDDVLTKYQSEFGDEIPIVTTFQGKPPFIDLKPPSQYELVKSCRMKPHKNKSYGLVEPIFRNILVFLVGTFLTKMEVSVLALANKLFAKVIPEISRLLTLNWKPIVEPRPDYDDQKEVSVERVDMHTALALQCGLDPGQIVRTLGG